MHAAIKNLLLVAAASTLLSGQGTSSSGSALELRLSPIGAKGGVPEGFVFSIVNTSDHDMLLPIPELECTYPFNGYILLRLVVKPLPLAGRGCAIDRGGNWPPILERAKSWKVLHAGETMTLKGDRKKLLFDDTMIGTYEFWSEYVPPLVSPVDANLLRGYGVEFADRPLQSGHLKFVRKP